MDKKIQALEAIKKRACKSGSNGRRATVSASLQFDKDLEIKKQLADIPPRYKSARLNSDNPDY